MGRVLGLAELAEEAERLRQAGKKLVLCHGCFDLMHPGHILHFQEARAMGDVLMVTVTPDAYIDKGDGRPAFSQDLRVLSVAALECVTFAAVNQWPTAEETLRLLRPHVYVKGQEFESRADRNGKLQGELAVLDEIGARMQFTHELVFSSTQLLNRYFLGGAPGKPCSPSSS